MEQKPLQKAERKTCGVCSMTLEPPKGICECDYYPGFCNRNVASRRQRRV